MAIGGLDVESVATELASACGGETRVGAENDGSAVSFRFVVAGVASSLVVLFAGASVILATGHSVPTELWAAASALSGALVGILVPAKRADAGAAAAKAGTEAGEAAAATVAATQPAAVADAAKAAQEAVEQARTPSDVQEAAMRAVGVAEATQAVVEAKPEDADVAAAHAAATAQVAILSAAAAAAAGAAEQAPPEPTTFLKIPVKAPVDFKIVVQVAVFLGTLGAGIYLAFHTGHEVASAISVRDETVKNVSGTLIALASAAGGALVGRSAAPASKITE